MKSKKQLAILVGSLVMVAILLATLLPLVVFADVPQRINYQGYLTDSGGNPVDGSVNIVFSIYDVDTGGIAIWTEPHTVVVNKGLFNVQLGSVNSLPSFSGSPRYLGIKVGADPEMTPRQLLASAPYALNAESVGGLNSTAFVLKSGDTMSASSNNPVLIVTNTGNGIGVKGNATGSYGTGVWGYATNNGSGTNWGGYFQADGYYGKGVQGNAPGSSGVGVYGWASNTGAALNYGGHFEADGSYGRGVYGYASNSGNVTNYGGYFQADGSSGIGVYGKATGANAYAGYFEGDVQVAGDLTVTGGIRGPNPMQIALLRWYDVNTSGNGFPAGDGPRAICFDGANIWVANYYSENVTKLKASDGSFVGNYNVVGYPRGICFDGANIWVANNAGNNVTKLKASDGSFVGTYTVGSNHYGICFDGANIWVTNGSSNNVTKLKASDGSFVGTYAVGNGPLGICFDGANIWVANYYSENVTKL